MSLSDGCAGGSYSLCWCWECAGARAAGAWLAEAGAAAGTSYENKQRIIIACVNKRELLNKKNKKLIEMLQNVKNVKSKHAQEQLLDMQEMNKNVMQSQR